MRGRKWMAGICVLLLAGTAFFSGCGKKEKEKEVHIGYFNNVTHAQALYMKNQGMLEKKYGDGVKVTWSAFNAGPAEVEALFSGDIDIGYIGPVPAINANVKSNGEVVILTGATKGGAVLVTRKDSGIQNVLDLKGKRISIPQIGNTQHLCLLDLLGKNGLKTVENGGDVTVSAVSNSDVANVMARGDIDAAVVPEPWGATLLRQEAQLLLDYQELFMEGNYDVAVVVVRKKYWEQYPERVRIFLEQHNMATEEITKNVENSVKTINEELKEATGKALEESILTESFERIGIDAKINKDSIKALGEISFQQKFIPETFEEKNLYAATKTEK